MNNKVIKELKQGKVKEMSSEKKSEHANKIIDQVINDLSDRKDRLLFFCPDIDVVNPLVKMIYDIVRVLNEKGVNAFVLHENDGFKTKWLKGYGKVKIDYLHKKISSKGKRLNRDYEFKLSDTMFIADVYLEILIDLPNVINMNLIQKTVLITGYSSLYTMTPGKTFQSLNVKNLIFLTQNVVKDFEKIYKGYIPHLLHTKYDNKLNSKKENVNEPYILVSGAGNIDVINEFANVFYNKYPLFDFFKIKIINRESYDIFAQEIKNAVLFVDLDRKYITNMNADIAMEQRTPYISSNGIREMEGELSFNLLNQRGDIFMICETVAEYLYYWTRRVSQDVYDEVYKNEQPRNNNEDFFNNISSIVKTLREQKISFFKTLKTLDEKTN